MLVVTPSKFNCLKNEDIRRSYQRLIDCILDFKEEHPHATKHELNVYAIGMMQGRTKHISRRRKSS